MTVSKRKRHITRRKKARSDNVTPAQNANVPQQQNQGSGFGNALAMGFGVGVGEAAGEDLFDSFFGGKRRRAKPTYRRSRRKMKKRSRR